MGSDHARFTVRAELHRRRQCQRLDLYWGKIQPIFTGTPAGARIICHGTAAKFNANLALSAGYAYPNLFGGGSSVVSTEHPPTPRIHKSVSSDSYLYRKVEGTQGALGGSFQPPRPGVWMPQGGGDLASADTDSDGTNDREEIRIWIDVLGAPGP
jgi:hypothetical protein